MNESEAPGVIVYSTTYCGHCVRLKRQLEEAGIPYRSIDIDMNERYGDRIARVTGGRASFQRLRWPSACSSIPPSGKCWTPWLLVISTYCKVDICRTFVTFSTW